MSNLPLQPLVWARIDTEKLAGIYCQKTDSYIKDAVSFCSTPVAEYVIRQDKETGKYRTNYGGRTENPYDTIDEAEHWAEHTHYASQMQPYVKPSPTWIDASKQLPSHHQDVIVYRYNDNDGGNIEHSLYLDGEVMKGFGNVADEDGFFDDVYYWQPIETKSLYEAMAMQLQISEAADD